MFPVQTINTEKAKIPPSTWGYDYFNYKDGMLQSQ
jgi:hypothetical protein